MWVFGLVCAYGRFGLVWVCWLLVGMLVTWAGLPLFYWFVEMVTVLWLVKWMLVLM